MDPMTANILSENEETETETNKTKVSDSGYSNSCSNSQSQHSNSSKSRHSTSSGSSGYCGHPSTSGSSDDHKKKKTKVEVISTTTESKEDAATTDTSFTPPRPADKEDKITVKKILPDCVDPALLESLASPKMDSEALQVGVVAQTLFCIKTKACEHIESQEMSSLQETTATVPTEPPSTDMIISALQGAIKHEKEFCIVVSLADGTVVYTTPTLTNVLGFPKDMWIGRSLINFMHPKDRIAFASHITSAMAVSHFKQKDGVIITPEKMTLEEKDYFYCWIRLYNGLKTSGFNLTEKNPNYISCQLSINFKEVPDQGVLLVATARVVKSAYKSPCEVMCNPPTFTTRHTANTLISHVDNEVITHYGYLPHDMIGRSIFDFYYAEDLPYLKDAYTNVIKENGPLFLSRPYKFRCQNGDYVMVDTEWSSFINPWGKKLEFIIGRHRVLTGPQNPDVVSPVLESNVLAPNEEELAESKKVFQEEIKLLLSEPIVRCYEPCKKQLEQLVESLDMISSCKPQDQSTSIPPVPSATSEMLGGISPHHVYSDSKSSSETPPSYNQLTYNENIQRFFASEPKTVRSDESRDRKMELTQSSSSGGEEKSFPNDSSFNSNSDRCLNGSKSGSGPSSNSFRLDHSNPDSSNCSKVANEKVTKYKPQPLTEEMLYQHNENMNKQMAQKHKKDKSKGQVNRKHKAEDNKQDDQGWHGMKRSVSHSWEGEPIKAFKGSHRERSTMPGHSSCERLQPTPANITGIWPGLPFTVPQSIQPLTAHTNYTNPMVNPIMQVPCVFMNTLPPAPPPPPSVSVACGNEHPGPPLGLRCPVTAPPQYLAHPVQYMPSLMYQLPLMPMAYTQSHIVPPTTKPRMNFIPTIAQMTSIPQQGLSDLSKKENKSHTSSLVYSPGGFTSLTGKTKNGTYDNDLTHDDTSYCSYSSLFPKTEKSDDSMKGSQDKDGQFKTWRSVSAGNSALRKVRKEPSWLENVEVTTDLMLRYQMGGCILSQVLESDLKSLLKYHQPEMVNEQLDQLYLDLEGLSKQMTLEESFPSSCSSGDEKHFVASVPSTSTSTCIKIKKKRKFMGHDRCAMIFEEDAPMPPSAVELLANRECVESS